MLKIALYQPDIPQNLGAMMRLVACMGVELDIIEPCGFVWNERKIRKAGLDYIDHVDYTRHNSWNHFIQANDEKRFVLMTTKAETSYLDFEFTNNDILIAGSESAGVPDDVHAQMHGRIAIPMKHGLRSLNIVNATSMILGEALRQTNDFS